MAQDIQPSAAKVIKDFLLPPGSESISEGEEIIRDFFEDEGLKYMREVELLKLRKDSKQYRRADFYLPKYGLYVEFHGLWNHSKEERERYREKMRVYAQNGIPCVYLYPENLGTLEHSFRRRSGEVFARYGMHRERLRFALKCWWNDRQLEILVTLGLAYLPFALTDLADRLVTAALFLWALIYGWRQWRRTYFPRRKASWAERQVPE